MGIGYLLTGVVVIFLVAVLAAPVYPEIDPESVVAFWSFDDGAGGTAEDNSENELDGELFGGPKWVDGKAAKALEFDGTDDYVEVSDILTPPVLTFACWSRRQAAGLVGFLDSIRGELAPGL